MIYKLTSFIFLSFFISASVSSQTYISIPLKQGEELIIEAGTDAEIEPYSGVILGGYPTAAGGDSEYIYTWTPETGLDNSAIANPYASPLETTLYTVLVTDGNGCSASNSVTVQVNDVTKIENINLLTKLTVFPNPSSDYLEIKLINEKVQDFISLSIINSLGQIVLQENINFKHEFLKKYEVSSLSGGIYYIKLKGSRINITKEFLIK